MADYPDFPQERGSKREIKSGILIDRALGGNVRRRVTYDSDQYEFEVHHVLGQTDWESLLSHYASDKEGSFNFEWAGDGNTYLVEYAAPPEEEPLGGGLRRVIVRLVSV